MARYSGPAVSDPIMGIEVVSHDLSRVGPNHLFGAASLFSHRTVVGLCGASALMLGSLFAVFKPITFTATTQLLIFNREISPSPEPVPVISPGPADKALIESAIEIFKSPSVLARVARSLKLDKDSEFTSDNLLQILNDGFVGGPGAIANKDMTFERVLERFKGKVGVKRAGTSHTILVSFTSSDPKKAAMIANEIAQSGSQVLSNRDSSSPRASLVRERLQGLGPSATVISAADPPAQPDGPRRIVLVFAAVVAGIGIGAALALFLDFRDRTIRTAAQIEHFLGLECLGVIPPLRRARRGGRPQSKPQTVEPGGALNPWLDDFFQPALWPAFNRARVVIHSILGLRTVGVTSAAPGEGATTVAAILAHVMARSGKRVLLVDGMRENHSLSRAMPSSVQERSTRLPAPARLLGAAVVRDGHAGVDVLRVSDPASVDTDAVWRNRMDEILHEATTRYDLVVVDLPSLSSGPDVRIAARKLDGLLLVLKWGATDMEVVRRALNLIGGDRCKFAGAVLNMAKEHLIGRYGDKLVRAEAVLATRRLAMNPLRSTEPGKLARA